MRKRTEAQKKWAVYVSSHVWRAKRKRFIRPEPCVVCEKKTKTHGHHMSYAPDRILSLIWLCPKHHKQMHKAFKPYFPSDKLCKEYLSKFVDYTVEHEKLMEARIRFSFSKGASPKEVTKETGYRPIDVWWILSEGYTNKTLSISDC